MPTELSPNEHVVRAPGSLQLDRPDVSSPRNKVEGTPVDNRAGEHLGSVYNCMVDKFTGQVAYAVMSFGGFLGLGESYTPCPERRYPITPGLRAMS